MLFSTNLLKQYISLDIAPEELMSKMTLHACEVEHISKRSIPDLVVVGYVTSTLKHPNADTLTICQLDCGSHGNYQICTAADNIKAEIFVPVALPGCYLPAIDLTIGSRKMRGEESNGMICAKSELGINEDADLHGIWIMDEDFNDLSAQDCGISLSKKYLYLDNTMLDVDNKTINNRPDLTGLLGMAIEMKAIFSSYHNIIKHQNISHIINEHNPRRALELLHHGKRSTQQIDIQTDKCSIYMILELDAIQVRKSPFYDRLSMIDSGLQAKNNRVDFSNLFATLSGQPIHCFDADKIDGTIVVRQAKAEEKFLDLQGNTHILNQHDTVIADNNEILALAGVIGGKNSAVSDTTQRIVIEIANFDPVAVRKTSKRIGVRTDAVSRFEKTISPGLTLSCFSLILDVLKQYKLMLGEYTITGSQYIINKYSGCDPISSKYIPFNIKKCQKLLVGNMHETTNLTEKAINTILESLGFNIKGNAVRVPRRRGPDDMNIAEDIYEEVARLYGYNRIPSIASVDAIEHIPFAGIVKINRIVEETLSLRYHLDQIQTYPRCDESFFDLFGYDRNNLVQLINATSPECSYLRPSMIPNLLLAIQKNSKIYDEFSLYDTGQTWNKSEQNSSYLNKQRSESTKLGIVSYKKSLSDRKDDTLLAVKEYLQGIVHALSLQGTISYEATHHTYYHPKKQGTINFTSRNNETITIGYLAQIHPQVLETLKIDPEAQVVVAELFLEQLSLLSDQQGYSFQTDGRYQTIQDQILTRDLCFVVDVAMPIGNITDIVLQVSGVSKVTLFDLYQGEHLPEGKKSITLTLTIVGDGTWTTDQINAVMDDAIAQVKKVGGELR